MVEVYIREPDGSLVARFEPGENPVAQYYYFDGLGSTVMMTEGLSTITDRYDYDAWGNEYPIMVSTADNPYRYVGQLGYYTHWMDPSLSDLLHLGVRFYEPGVGRFSQRDPAGEGLNWFIYVDSQPTVDVDPTGMFDIAPFIDLWHFIECCITFNEVINERECANRCCGNKSGHIQLIQLLPRKLSRLFIVRWTEGKGCKYCRCWCDDEEFPHEGKVHEYVKILSEKKGKGWVRRACTNPGLARP